MKILALEFSSPQQSVAVVQREPNVRHFVASEVIETGVGATRALGMIEEALRQAKLEREQIESLAIGIGPGSYTGVRATIALAQGWQLARGVKLLGISSAECVAAHAQADGLRDIASVVIDAQRGEFYLADYELGASGWREIGSLRLAALAEVRERERAGAVLIGPEVTRWFSDGRVVFPRAATLGRVALERTDFVAGERLEPIYLRETSFVKAPPPRALPI